MHHSATVKQLTFADVSAREVALPHASEKAAITQE